MLLFIGDLSLTINIESFLRNKIIYILYQAAVRTRWHTNRFLFIIFYGIFFVDIFILFFILVYCWLVKCAFGCYWLAYCSWCLKFLSVCRWKHCNIWYLNLWCYYYQELCALKISLNTEVEQLRLVKYFEVFCFVYLSFIFPSVNFYLFV